MKLVITVLDLLALLKYKQLVCLYEPMAHLLCIVRDI